jgi:hypothetical protein
LNFNGLHGVISQKIVIFNIKNGSGDHPASHKMGTGSISPGVKRQRREADHSPPSRAEVKNSEAIPPLPHTTSWRGVKLINLTLLYKVVIIKHTTRAIPLKIS